jgi:hypothetical protein
MRGLVTPTSHMLTILVEGGCKAWDETAVKEAVRHLAKK